MNGTQLADLCARRFRNETQQAHDETHWLHLLSQAQFEMLGEARMPLEEQTTNIVYSAGDGDENLPAGVWAVRTVRNATTGYLLSPMHSWRVWEQVYADDSERGDPIHYRLAGRELQIRPRPSTGLTIAARHWAPAADITAGTEPIIPSSHHRSLVDGALALAMLDDGELDQYDRYQSRWNKAVQRVKTQMARERLGRHAPVSKRFTEWA